MAISGSQAFMPDVGDIVQEAYERAGLELRSGYDLRSARRSINLLTLEWQNRGINLWTVEEVNLGTLTKSDPSYDLSAGTISVLDMILRLDAGSVSKQMDYSLSLISQSTYATIPNKLQEGRPLQYYLERREVLDVQADGTDRADRIILWPVPDSSTAYQIRYWRLKRIDDAGTGAANTMEIPGRFLPALVSGLAYQIALKRPEAAQKLGMLKQDYEQQFSLAAEEDREKATIRFVPMSYQT
jgi:hypothetical protein